MRTRPSRQLDLTDSFLPAAPANDFLDRLDALVDWQPIQRQLESMFTATTGRLPQPPLAVFKMLLLENFYGLSDPQCEALVLDRLSWRKFTGLALTDRVHDETTLVRFRQRLIEHGLHLKLLALVNEQLATKGLIVREVTLVDATLVQAARRAPTKGSRGGGDADADYTVKAGQPHYGYKAHVAADRQHTLIRKAKAFSADQSRHGFGNVFKRATLSHRVALGSLSIAFANQPDVHQPLVCVGGLALHRTAGRSIYFGRSGCEPIARRQPVPGNGSPASRRQLGRKR